MTREDFITNVKAEQKHLRMFLLGLCGDSQTADDLAQETLMKAYIASAEYRPWHRFSTWLLKIALNTYLDHRKLYHVRNRSPLEAADDRPDSAASDERFVYQKLYQALETLVEKERTAVLLFYIYGFSVKEISGITGESAQAVKKQLQRAREHLKSKLEE